MASYNLRSNHNGYRNDNFVDDSYGQNYNSDEDYSPDEEYGGGGQGGYGPYSSGKSRSGPGDRRLDGGHDGRKRPGGNNPQGYNGTGKSGNRNQNSNRRARNYDDDDDGDDDDNQGGYGRYSTGKSRSGQGDRRLDGGHDGRKKPGGNNPQGYNGQNGSGNRNRNQSNNYNRRNNNYNDDDSDDYDDDDDNQGGYGPYSTGKSRSGQGDRRLDGGHDGRKKPGGNNPQGYNGQNGSGNRNRNQSNNYNRRNNNYDDSDDYDDDDDNQGGYGPYSSGKSRSGQGDRRLDGGHDGRKKPGGNNPQGYNGTGKSGNRNRNYQNDNDDDDADEDYGQRTGKQNKNNYSYNSTGRQNRSGQGDRKLDGGKDRRKKPNRSENYDENY